MRRSAINQKIASAKQIAGRNLRVLPAWSDWSEAEYRENPDVAKFLFDRQMGWDITDFGAGNFAERGLVLFCLRNGIQGAADERPYAEKMLVVEEGQETPFHLHKIKLEDIINCAGGNLMIEFLDAADEDAPVTVRSDGQAIRLAPREALRLKPGQSVTVERGVYHRFYGEAGHGPVLAWEVSQVNDDHADNYFLEELGRFSTIEEDERSVNPLWHELSAHY
ncbi:D-lyxose/D-mannose family sugar isomerase [Rhizobium sp. P38BS-XIX]|uniref:D-lyxose/D-mannose family sugar isomerase n=1 Tax=Rhizobium sp. P38BS-XIX TaxID=2726740 RepID=UPI001456920F|nr:D-lyxose/D-mannose family sugar isomerase [Rhizobium sp. P38BS-XIX]